MGFYLDFPSRAVWCLESEMPVPCTLAWNACSPGGVTILGGKTSQAEVGHLGQTFEHYTCSWVLCCSPCSVVHHDVNRFCHMFAPPCLPHNGRLTPLRLILHVGVFFLMLLPLWNLPQWPQRTNTLGLQNVTWKIIKFLTGDSSLWTAGDVKRKRLTWEDNDLQRLEFFFLF